MTSTGAATSATERDGSDVSTRAAAYCRGCRRVNDGESLHGVRVRFSRLRTSRARDQSAERQLGPPISTSQSSLSKSPTSEPVEHEHGSTNGKIIHLANLVLALSRLL